MPRRGPAQAGRRRDLSRGAAGHRRGALRMTTSIHRYPDNVALVAAAAERLAEQIVSVVEFRGRASIVLTGGGTVIGLLKTLGERGENVDWWKVHWYWGDERFVAA